ncbi:MAG: exonuclease subunit SbcD [Alphaproteobacteria bacterium]|nr:exonuclease subunit SbcD [Alphaproteobacteria bacterium]
MRILHASDWHLGKTLEGRSRIPEQADYLDEVVRLAADVDLVLIAGDVFDVYNPPIDAEELYFETLARLGDGGRRPVVVIAGNHDSPDRIAAATPLAAAHGVYILGRVGQAPKAGGGVSYAAPGVLGVGTPCGQEARIAALPYPSEARLSLLLTETVRERSLQHAYSEKVKAVLTGLAEHFDPGAVNLMTSHLQVRACLASESERALVGGAYQVETDVFPASAQYVALGHLHRAQDVPGAPTAVRYCGAPLAFRFSEAGEERTHTLVEVEPGGAAVVHRIPIDAGRPLAVWQAESFQAVLAGVEAGLHADAFVDLQLQVDRALTHAELATLRKLPRDFVRIRAVLPEAALGPVDRQDRLELAPAELFKAFHRDATGTEPDDALVDLFVQLASDVVAEARS